MINTGGYKNMELICTSQDKKLQYQVMSGTDVIQMKDCVGKEINMMEIIQSNTTNQDGEDVICTSLVDADGSVYQTLSPTVADNVQSLWRIFKEEIEAHQGVKVLIIEKKSNKGNRFLSLSLL